MFDVVEMMRSLSHLCFTILESIAVDEGVKINGKYSKVELITAIIANRVEKSISQRKNFCITSDDDGVQHFVALTRDQINLYHYLENKGLFPSNDQIEEVEKVKFEAP